MNLKSRLHWIFVCLWLVGLAALAGCNVQMITGSGNVVTREFDYSDFNQVEISHAFEGAITQGAEYRVVVRVDDNLEQYLLAEQAGDRVRIGLEDVLNVGQATMEYEITMPSLAALDLSGAAQAQLSGFTSSDAFEGEASGASRMAGDLTSGNTRLHASGASTIALDGDRGDAQLEASGASTITLTGQGGTLAANASGASTIDLEAFPTTSANATASGASNVTVNTTGRLDADASGASNIHYLGQPALGDIEESGGSNVEQR